VTIVLLTDPALEFVSRHDLELELPRPPGVIIKAGGQADRMFVFAYRENPDTFVYRETVAVKVT
jgi:hypothetical protein